MQAVAVVANLLLILHLRFAQTVESIGAAKTAKCFARLQQQIGMVAIDIRALALTIGTVRAAIIRALIPVQTQPVQRI